MAKLVLYTQWYDDPVNFLGVIDEENLPEVIEKAKEWIHNKRGIKEEVVEVKELSESCSVYLVTKIAAYSNISGQKWPESKGGYSIDYYRIEEDKINDITIHSL